MKLNAIALVMGLGLMGCGSINEAVGYRGPPNIEHPAFAERYRRLDAMQAALHAYALEQGDLPDGDDRQAIDGDPPTISAENFTTRLNGYVNGRLDQIDATCGIFFQGMERLSSNTRWGRDQFNALTDFAAIMMGVTGSAADQLTLLAGFRGLANDSFEAASTAMLITPDPYRVEDLVRLEQARIEASFTGRPLATYREAQRRVREYARPCTLTGIRSLIAESLEARIQVSQELQTAPATFLDPLKTILNQGAAEADQVATIPRDALAHLYWLFSLSPTDSERVHLIGSLDGTMRSRVEATLANPRSVEGMRSLFQTMDIVQPTLRTQAMEAQRQFRAAEAARTAAEAIGQGQQQGAPDNGQ